MPFHISCSNNPVSYRIPCLYTAKDEDKSSGVIPLLMYPAAMEQYYEYFKYRFEFLKSSFNFNSNSNSELLQYIITFLPETLANELIQDIRNLVHEFDFRYDALVYYKHMWGTYNKET